MKNVFGTIAVLLFLMWGANEFADLKYEPIIKEHDSQIRSLSDKVSNLSRTISEYRSELLSAERENVDLQQRNSKLGSDLLASQKESVGYHQLISDLNSQLSSSLGRLNKVLGVTVTEHYEWSYLGVVWKWDLPMPVSLYVHYLEKPRPKLGSQYVELAKDPEDDTFIDKIIQNINNADRQRGFTEVQKLNFVTSFVQSLPYTEDIVTTSYDEYPRYPVETLFDRGGDCEDTSILAAAILDKMGYDVALLLLRKAQHMAVGISLPAAYGSYYEYQGKKYYYLETTGDGWQIGQFPPDITERGAEIYPLRNSIP